MYEGGSGIKYTLLATWDRGTVNSMVTGALRVKWDFFFHFKVTV